MKKEKIYPILFIVFIAFGFLTICSRSSFLYPFNNWDDSNSYFSMGKMMMNGKVIYRDAFDQKGPLLYFIYGLGYLISNTDFTGIFLMEILFLAAFLIAVYKISCLYLTTKLSLCLLPITALVITVSKSFYWGGCAEEFCLPFLAWGFYFSIKYFKTIYPTPISYKTTFLCGFFAGCIMLIKYNILGFYFSWILIITLANFNRQNRKHALKNCFVFMAGILFPLLPWLLYFGIHGALDDWYHAYIYCNVFLYSDLYYKETISLGSKIYTLVKTLYWVVLDNFIYFSFIILGFAALLFSKKSRWYEKINIYSLFFFLFLGIYIGGTTLYYYPLPLSVFCILGIIFLGQLLEVLHKNIAVRGCLSKYYFVISFFLCTCTLLLARNMSMNTEYSREKPDDLWFYTFRDLILQKENPTLLNISCLDAGLYTLADILPTCRYFQSNAVHGFDEVANEQLRYIKEGQTEFVLARDYYPEELLLNYELVSSLPYHTNEYEYIYYLFQKK